jgi:hypothetical protein
VHFAEDAGEMLQSPKPPFTTPTKLTVAWAEEQQQVEREQQQEQQQHDAGNAKGVRRKSKESLYIIRPRKLHS